MIFSFLDIQKWKSQCLVCLVDLRVNCERNVCVYLLTCQNWPLWPADQDVREATPTACVWLEEHHLDSSRLTEILAVSSVLQEELHSLDCFTIMSDDELYERLCWAAKCGLCRISECSIVSSSWCEDLRDVSYLLELLSGSIQFSTAALWAGSLSSSGGCEKREQCCENISDWDSWCLFGEEPLKIEKAKITESEVELSQ